MIYILLPAYNEEKDIRPLLKRIEDTMRGSKAAQYQVIVVNDGSTDQTAAIVDALRNEMPVERIDHAVNKGLGQAMLTGLRHAKDQVDENDWVVTMDADNTHDPAIIESMIARGQRGADIVIASRYEKGGQEIGLSVLRQIMSRSASRLLSIFFPMPGVKDYTCGYRVYRGSILKRAFQVYGDSLVEEHGFTCMAEILIKLRAVGARVAESPLVLRYDLKSGASKMKVAQTILRYFVLIGHNLHLQPAASHGDK